MEVENLIKYPYQNYILTLHTITVSPSSPPPSDTYVCGYVFESQSKVPLFLSTS